MYRISINVLTLLQYVGGDMYANRPQHKCAPPPNRARYIISNMSNWYTARKQYIRYILYSVYNINSTKSTERYPLILRSTCRMLDAEET